MASNFKLFPVNSSEKRRRNKYIILMHVADTSQRFRPMKPLLKEYSTSFVFRGITDYFKESLEVRHIPFHYYVADIVKDWEVLTSSPLTVRSDILKDAISCGYLDPIFEDALVICVQDNFALRIPDSRMYDCINQRCITPNLNLLKMGNFLDNVYWYDEVFRVDKYNADMEVDSLNNKYRYEFRQMKYFRRLDFNLSSRQYN